MKSSIQNLCAQLIEQLGEDVFEERLNRMRSEGDGSVLTIIANAGVHPLAPAHLRGEVFVASEGNLNFESSESIHAEITKVLHRLAQKLRSKPWKKVYLVPFGPSVLSAQIKLLVYKILHVTTIDVLHTGSYNYVDVNISVRDVAVRAFERYPPDETEKA